MNLELIKQNFQTLYSNEATNLFTAFGQSKFQQLFGVDNIEDFLNDVVPDLNNPIYNFIKIE